AAVKILGAFDVDALRHHVMEGDADFLTNVPGIGKKKAQKIVLELRGSIDFEREPGVLPGHVELVQALVSLGYERDEAQHMAGAVSPDTQRVEDQIKEALRGVRA
ncbi:Holliday junction branch migration protein RuvA, partial [Candidatus Uhrbacteria bacterium]|nr:Holliday junction branch migration protein RuvA [Candidatus Uhrbacteria bacterium]